MEMMHMMMDKQLLDDDDLPQQIQIPLPFQHLISDSSPLMEFSGGSTTSNQPTPSPQSHMIYPPPPLIMQFSPLQFRTSTLPRGAGGSSWFQQMKPPLVDSSVEAMREMIFRMAALQPVQIDPESIKPPKRRNVKISKDPQSVAARHRRERISERIRILQRLVPGGTKMDTASMLDEAAHYMKFLKNQVQSLEQAAAASATMPTKTSPAPPPVVGCCTTTMNNNIHGTNNNSHLIRACGQPAATQASHVLARLSCGDA